MHGVHSKPTTSHSDSHDRGDGRGPGKGVHMESLNLTGVPSFRKPTSVGINSPMIAGSPMASPRYAGSPMTSPRTGASNNHHKDTTHGSNHEATAEGGHITTPGQGGQVPPLISDISRRISMDFIPVVEDGVEVLFKDISTLLVAVASKGQWWGRIDAHTLLTLILSTRPINTSHTSYQHAPY